MKAAVLMGSASDLTVLESTIRTLKTFGIEVESHVISAHRTPGRRMNPLFRLKTMALK